MTRVASRLRSGFTLVETIVVVAILTILAALLLPVVTGVSDSTARVRTLESISHLLMGMRAYQLEDPYRLYPPSASDDLVAYDPQDPTAVLTIMCPDENLADPPRKPGGYTMEADFLSEPVGTRRLLLDGWGRPLRYRLDGLRRGAGGTIDPTTQDAVIDRPADLPGWNPDDDEAFPYIWSIGKPINDDHEDAAVANAANWIYEGMAE